MLNVTHASTSRVILEALLTTNGMVPMASTFLATDVSSMGRISLETRLVEIEEKMKKMM